MKNEFENVGCKIVAILSRLPCDKETIFEITVLTNNSMNTASFYFESCNYMTLEMAIATIVYDNFQDPTIV